MSNNVEKSELKKVATFIKLMMDKAEITPKIAAECIGCSVGTFRNKLTLDRFSVKDLILISELCDYHLAFVPDKITDPTELLLADSYISSEDKATMKAYRKERLQKHLDILDTYMKDMSIEERQQFIQEHLPGMLNGSSPMQPKK